jgi:hypothetical protein
MTVKLYRFFDAIPLLLELKNPQRWSWIMRAIFNDEKMNKASVFGMSAEDLKNPDNRLDQAFAFESKVSDRRWGLYAYLRRLCLVAMLTHYKDAHDIHDYDARLEQEMRYLIDEEESYPEVAEYLTVQDVVEDSFWDE